MEKELREKSMSELISFIIETYHNYAYKAFPELSGLALAAIREDGIEHPEVFKVHKSINTLRIGLEQHLITEEETFYPLITDFEETGNRTSRDKAAAIIDQIEEEHVGAGHLFASMRKATADFAIPANASAALSNLYAGIQALEKSTTEHIECENTILHPKLREA